jgi:glycosyltransferase involved in cell wall biosynthesis
LAPRKILFVHQNFPGQFPFIADALVKRGDEVAAIGSKFARDFPGVMLQRWTNSRVETPGIWPAAAKPEADFIHAEAAAFAAMVLKSQGFIPDLIIGHPGWGETLFLNQIFPEARQILFGEIFYRSTGQDLDFDPEFGVATFSETLHALAKNATSTLAYSYADRIVVPTPFQAASFPKIYSPRLRVLHEGIDLQRARRKSDAVLSLPDGRTLDGSKPVVTFINRTFERVRGFPIFMRALPRFLAAVPEAEVILIGDEEGRGLYGKAPPGGGRWKDWMLGELGDRLDHSRVNFIGRVPHQTMVDAFSISWAHVYYSYPFVLSWSLIEAMACECLILGSDTAQLRDVVINGQNGLLNDFHDVEALTDAMIRAAREPGTFRAMRKAARESVFARFDLETVGLPGWLDEIDAVLA